MRGLLKPDIPETVRTKVRSCLDENFLRDYISGSREKAGGERQQKSSWKEEDLQKEIVKKTTAEAFQKVHEAEGNEDSPAGRRQ